jgi:hypothetical protein
MTPRPTTTEAAARLRRTGDPTRIRTAVAALKGPSPGPLDDGVGARKLAEDPRRRKTLGENQAAFPARPGQTSRCATGRSRKYSASPPRMATAGATSVTLSSIRGHSV